jgi:hypothetical protein
VTRNGRVDHPPGGHDDVCIAWLLGHYVASHSRNLDFYGIDTREIMSQVIEDGAVLSEKEIAKKSLLNKARAELDVLKQRLQESDLPKEQYRLQMLIQKKLDEVEEYGGTALSLESILQEAKEAKSKRRKLRDAIRRFAG